MAGNTLEEVEESLVKEIERCRYIVEGLDNNASYMALVADFKQAADEIDSVWHLQQDLNKLTEMRITKLAAQSLVGALDSYKMSLKRATEQLKTLKEEEDAS